MAFMLCLIIGVAIGVIVWAVLDIVRTAWAGPRIEPPTFEEHSAYPQRLAAGGITGAADTGDE